MPSKTLYLVRGLPGSGKSTLALRLALRCGLTARFETDNYWTTERPFDPQELSAAHAWTQGLTQEAMQNGVLLIIVSNTFTRLWEMEPYKVLATQYGYQAVEITVESRLSDEELAQRNIHGVPKETIAKMRQRWEV